LSPVLVDTSVWVEHFKATNPELLLLLGNDRVLAHPLVIGEIACGTPPDRARTLADLADLEATFQATPQECISFIERKKLYGCGVGFIDIQLLASALMTPDAQFWTLDRKLQNLATKLGIAYASSH
jgi:predicted nucleic acid-binding protein